MGVLCELSEQRSNQSGFSFELKELSTKFSGLSKAEKKDQGPSSKRRLLNIQIFRLVLSSN